MNFICNIKKMVFTFFILISSIKICNAQTVINKNSPIIVDQSIKIIASYFENFNDSSFSYETDGAKMQEIIKGENKVIIRLTGNKNTLGKTVTSAQDFNDFIKKNSSKSNGILLLAKSTVTPKYANNKIPPPEKSDSYHFGFLTWQIELTELSESTTKITFNFTSLNSDNRNEFLKTYFIKNDEFHSYELMKVYIPNDLRKSIIKF